MNSATRDRVTLSVSDGTTMSAYVARPESGNLRSGILVLQEAFGVNSQIRSVSDRLAKQGYVAIAPELFHRTAPGFEGDYKNFQATPPHIQAMTMAGMEADLRAAFDWLRSQSSIGKDEIFSVGFCMGGRVSFIANSILPLHAAVSFYGGRIAPDLLNRAADMQSPILFFWGGHDHHITPEQRSAVTRALDAAGKTYADVVFSNADHGFFNEEREAYHPQAARQAWSLMLEFLRS